METEVLVEVRDVYGASMVYPANNTAVTLTLLTGKKTFNLGHIRAIKQLGYQITVKQGQLPWAV